MVPTPQGMNRIYCFIRNGRFRPETGLRYGHVLDLMENTWRLLNAQLP